MIVNGIDLSADTHTLSVTPKVTPAGTNYVAISCGCGWQGPSAQEFVTAYRRANSDWDTLPRTGMTDDEILAYLDGGSHHRSVKVYADAVAQHRH